MGEGEEGEIEEEEGKEEAGKEEECEEKEREEERTLILMGNLQGTYVFSAEAPIVTILWGIIQASFGV